MTILTKQNTESLLCHNYDKIGISFSLLQNESPCKKARRSLERKWSTPGDINLFGGISGESLGINPETPVNSYFTS